MSFTSEYWKNTRERDLALIAKHQLLDDTNNYVYRAALRRVELREKYDATNSQIPDNPSKQR